MLGKIKIVYRFRPISNRTTSTKDFICRNKGISKLASIASLKFRGFIFSSAFHPTLFPPLSFFPPLFPSQLNSFHPLDRGVCCHPEMGGEKKRRGRNKREQFENNLQSISLFLFLCVYMCVCVCVFKIEKNIKRNIFNSLIRWWFICSIVFRC